MAEGSKCKKEELQRLIDKGLWENLTWSEIWDRNARQYPDDEAIVDFRRRLT
jgi:non-ribosomal peptide synthetase component E (peptide arylation enzyme)